MRKHFLLGIIIIFVIGVFTSTYHIQTVGADSGFDSSYDGGSDFGGSDFGGSGWGGSNWSDSDYGSSSGGSSGSSGSEMSGMVFFGMFLIFFLVLGLLSELGNNGSNESISKTTSDDEIDKLLGKDFDKKIFIKESFEVYRKLQTAWMDFDYDKIKELVNDEIYNMYINQLETLKIKNQQNIMADIKLLEGHIIDYKKVNNKEVFKVYLSVSCYDYIINTKNNEVVRGKEDKKITLSYDLTFERNIEVVEYCPKCGAPVKDLTECEYCRSKVVNNTSKLVMTKKEIKSQK